MVPLAKIEIVRFMPVPDPTDRKVKVSFHAQTRAEILLGNKNDDTFHNIYFSVHSLLFTSSTINNITLNAIQCIVEENAFLSCHKRQHYHGSQSQEVQRQGEVGFNQWPISIVFSNDL